MESRIHLLELVYPPITNQEGARLWEDEDVRAYVARSKLYMIGQRQELFFDNLERHSDGISFDLVCGDDSIRGIFLPLSVNGIAEDATIEVGARVILVYGDEQATDIKRWWTPDSLLYEHWRGEVASDGLEDYRKFTRFRLWYVGISKSGDSYSRLFDQAHHGRLNILTEERQITPEARLSDELYIFMFDIDPLILRVHGEEPVSLGGEPEYDGVQAVADAEKALIKIMNSKHNEVKYLHYPFSEDGLHGSGLFRWAFSVNEDITLETDDEDMFCRQWMKDPNMPGGGDFIAVDDEHVALIKVERAVE